MQSLNVVFTGKNELELRRESVPELESGQLLIETRASLISTGTECICLNRNFAPGTHWDNWVKYPFHPGYGNAGRVLQVGPDVEGFKVGDRVASRGPHGQIVIADAARAVLIPDKVSDEDAAWFGLAGIVQNGVRCARHELGDSVVIIGLGLLGQLAVQYVRAFGASEVIAIDFAPARLEMAKSHGATMILEMGADEAKSHIESLPRGGADVVYDITGHPKVFGPALGLARHFGKLLLLGDAGDPDAQHLTSAVIRHGLQIIGAHDIHPPQEATDRDWWTHANMTHLFFKFLERGQMRVSDLITHRYAPQDAPQAYEMLLKDRSSAMGVVFDWSSL